MIRMQNKSLAELAELFKEHNYPKVLRLHPDDFFEIVHRIAPRDLIATDRFSFMSGEVRPSYPKDQPDEFDCCGEATRGQ